MPRPLSIPFSGEYWMFRWPYARPPKTSFFQRGSPAALSFSSTDHRPLQMEARHKLDQPVALSCCSAIRLEIRNADRYPGTISLELVLINNEQPGAPSLNLGRSNVTSRPDFSRDPVVPVPETLELPDSCHRRARFLQRVQNRLPARPRSHGQERQARHRPLHPDAADLLECGVER